MQSILARISRSFAKTPAHPLPTRPVELDAQACRAVSGGLPKHTWSVPSGSTAA